ncbi:MAG: DNA methylase, partial [Acidimicrobiia bacterium]|nr:DNA methylase [Acidimicrobiia bacterium]
PFGHNKYYSDLALLNESWHRVRENTDQEAIVNESKVVPRTLPEYQSLMGACFAELYRVLKPGRWMTVEFSNSQSAVWLAIQESLSNVGFVVADTRIFDKKQGTFQQLVAKNAVKRDLIISAYKPSSETEERFSLVAGTVDGAWEFVREHLSHLAVSEGVRGEVRVVRERMADRLYDRMVAYHVHRGVTVPLTAAEFYSGLEQRFPVRDDMYFLSEQVEGYERHRMTVKDLIQAELFITNEQSAVQWLRQLLKRKPRPYAEIQPVFFGELQAGLPEWEALPELRALLDESFLQDGAGRWYVPDPKKSEDLEKLRTRSLLKEFEAYREGKGRLDRFRSEAVRAGFKEAWARRDFAIIVAVGKRLPDDAFVEDEALLYYYDNARRLAPS